MSINIPLFTCGDNFTLNCFGCKKTSDEEKRKKNVERQKQQQYESEIDNLNDVFHNSKYDIVILPIDPNVYSIQNLFPYWNHVQTWDIFIVGCDKTYILAQINSFETASDLSSSLPNNKGYGRMDTEFYDFLEPVWDRTLSGVKLQLFMQMREKTYLINTFPLTNTENKVIGGVLFMRDFNFNYMMPDENVAVRMTEERASQMHSELTKLHKQQVEDLLRRQDYERRTAQMLDHHIHEAIRKSMDTQ